MAPPDSIKPNDPRITTESVKVPTSGHTYTYLFSTPPADVKPKGTILLLHGFPDLAFGWRNQILFLSGLGLKVVVPNMLGYAGTDAPADPKHYTYKNISRDVSEIAQHVSPNEQIYLGGHDWGGALVWRVGLWYPQLIKGIFAVCAPFAPPSAQKKFMHPADILPNFRYQKHFAGQEVEDGVRSSQEVWGFLNAMYGWGFKERIRLFDVTKGFNVEEMKKHDVGLSPLVSKAEMDFYVSQYMIHMENPMHGPLNWYRVHEANYNDEQAQGWGEDWRKDAEKGGRRFEIPALAVVGTRDSALPPSMSEGMEQWWRKGSEKGGLSRVLVEANHWALWMTAEEVNNLIAKWFSDEFGLVSEKNSVSSPRL